MGSVGSGIFGLIVDEADAFQRTENDDLQVSKGLVKPGN
jgi:hypothetical protein